MYSGKIAVPPGGGGIIHTYMKISTNFLRPAKLGTHLIESSVMFLCFSLLVSNVCLINDDF
jgi:hypothetical protein